MEDPIEVKKNNEKLSACIRLALNLDNLFKLYSYRIVEPQVFTEQVLDVQNATELISRTETNPLLNEDN